MACAAAILVVDDNRQMGRMIASMVTAGGFGETALAGDAEHARAMIVAHAPTAVLSDINMPGDDGLALTRWIRRDPQSPISEAPVLMVSGHAASPVVTAARDEGATDFLVKPLAPATLIAKLSDALARPRKFVRAMHFIGPCRRTRPTPVHLYAGPMRRLEDDDDPMAGAPDVEACVRRVGARVQTLDVQAQALDPRDRVAVRAVRDAAAETVKDAEAVGDAPMADTAGSLHRYVDAVGLSGALDREVVAMHAAAMGNLLDPAVRVDNGGQEVVDGLKKVVAKRLRERQGRPVWNVTPAARR